MYHPDVTVQIMAGGRSLRMGYDKAQLKLGGVSLLERAVMQWEGWGSELMVSVGGEERAIIAPPGVKAIFDAHPGRGPLEGFYCGAMACKTNLMLLRAVDTPFLAPIHAAPLLEAIGKAGACVYTVENRLQPLFGLYRPIQCCPAARSLLDKGEFKMGSLLDMVDTVVIPAPEPIQFLNVNTPEELRVAESIMGRDHTRIGRCTPC